MWGADMYKRFVRLLVQMHRARVIARSEPCDRVGCKPGVHYHWGYNQRHSGQQRHTGPNDFSDGRPYYKE